MANLVIREVDPGIVAELKKHAAQAGKDLNTYVKGALAAAAKKRRRKVVFHDLDHLAGTWTRQQHKDFTATVARLGRVDKEMW
ncbi:MAG: hypothetical protein ABSE73_23830 [Planctomycetota bacterium]